MAKYISVQSFDCFAPSKDVKLVVLHPPCIYKAMVGSIHTHAQITVCCYSIAVHDEGFIVQAVLKSEHILQHNLMITYSAKQAGSGGV